MPNGYFLVLPVDLLPYLAELEHVKLNESVLKNGYAGSMALDEDGEPIIELYTTDGSRSA